MAAVFVESLVTLSVSRVAVVYSLALLRRAVLTHHVPLTTPLFDTSWTIRISTVPFIHIGIIEHTLMLSPNMPGSLGSLTFQPSALPWRHVASRRGHADRFRSRERRRRL